MDACEAGTVTDGTMSGAICLSERPILAVFFNGTVLVIVQAAATSDHLEDYLHKAFREPHAGRCVNEC